MTKSERKWKKKRKRDAMRSYRELRRMGRFPRYYSLETKQRIKSGELILWVMPVRVSPHYVMYD